MEQSQKKQKPHKQQSKKRHYHNYQASSQKDHESEEIENENEIKDIGESTLISLMKCDFFIVELSKHLNSFSDFNSLSSLNKETRTILDKHSPQTQNPQRLDLSRMLNTFGDWFVIRQAIEVRNWKITFNILQKMKHPIILNRSNLIVNAAIDNQFEILQFLISNSNQTFKLSDEHFTLILHDTCSNLPPQHLSDEEKQLNAENFIKFVIFEMTKRKIAFQSMDLTCLYSDLLRSENPKILERLHPLLEGQHELDFTSPNSVRKEAELCSFFPHEKFWTSWVCYSGKFAQNAFDLAIKPDKTKIPTSFDYLADEKIRNEFFKRQTLQTVLHPELLRILNSGINQPPDEIQKFKTRWELNWLVFTGNYYQFVKRVSELFLFEIPLVSSPWQGKIFGLFEFVLKITATRKLPLDMVKACVSILSESKLLIQKPTNQMKWISRNLAIYIFDAIKHNRLDIIKAVESVSKKQPKFRFVVSHLQLQAACVHGHLDIVLYFLEKWPRYLKQAMYFATKAAQIHILKALLKRNPSLANEISNLCALRSTIVNDGGLLLFAIKLNPKCVEDKTTLFLKRCFLKGDLEYFKFLFDFRNELKLSTEDVSVALKLIKKPGTFMLIQCGAETDWSQYLLKLWNDKFVKK